MCASIVSLLNDWLTVWEMWDDWTIGFSFFVLLLLLLFMAAISVDGYKSVIVFIVPHLIQSNGSSSWSEINQFQVKLPNCDVKWKDYNVWYEFVFMKL